LLITGSGLTLVVDRSTRRYREEEPTWMDTDENIASYQYYLLILIELLSMLLLMMMLVQSIEMMVLVKLIFVLLSIHCLFLQYSPVYHSSVELNKYKKNQ
jgi:hypothetical protein